MPPLRDSNSTRTELSVAIRPEPEARAGSAAPKATVHNECRPLNRLSLKKGAGLKIPWGLSDARIFGWNTPGSYGPRDLFDGMEARRKSPRTIHWIGQSRENVYP